MPQFVAMKWQDYTGFGARVVELALHQAGGTSTKKESHTIAEFYPQPPFFL